MIITIFPSSIRGEIALHPSKSYMQRALIAGLLTEGTTQIFNPGNTYDDLSMVNNIQKLGATISYGHNYISVRCQTSPVQRKHQGTGMDRRIFKNGYRY